MKIDGETGEIELINYETYENMKEEKDKIIENLNYRIEDLEDELNKAIDNIEFLLNFLQDSLKMNLYYIKKDPIVAATESK